MSHALFPVEGTEAEDNRDIAWICVSRYENGAWEFAPGMLPAHEVEDLTRIQEEFGGGRYELVARSTDRRRITARAKYNLAGPSKPMVPTAAPAVAVDATPAKFDPVAMMLTQQANMMQMFMTMQAQQTQVLVAAMQGKQQDVSPMVTAVAGMAAQQSQQAAAMMAAARAPAQGAGPGMGADEARKWMELGMKLKESAGGGDDLLETFGVVLAGMMQGAQQNQQAQAAAAQPAAAPTGS